MKPIPRAVAAVTLTIAFAFAAVRAADTVSPPSNHTADSENAAYKSNAEDFSGQNSTRGRFQLFQGNSWMAAGTNTATIPVVMKIDSQTGKAWMLILMETTNGTTMGFAEMKDVKQK